MNRSPLLAATSAALIFLSASASAGTSSTETSWRQEIAFEARQFAQSSRVVNHNQDTSLSWSAHYEVTEDNRSFTFVPYAIINSQDDERSRFDIQSLSWTWHQRRWEFRGGIRTVTWQTTEAEHLVDILNQNDFTGDIDREDKLGQPMLNWVYKPDWGTLELFVLPSFRERLFPGERTRLRGPLEFSTDDAAYESSAEELRTDVAVRSTILLGDAEIAISHFSGTSREPILRLVDNQLGSYYPVIDQTGLEWQYAAGDWLWKLEAISRSGFNDESNAGFDRYEAAVGGFEFTWSGLGESGYDLGILAEYLWASRREEPLSDDVFIGVRLGLNDLESTDLLAGAIVDTDHSEYLAFAEFSRRIAEVGRIDITARAIGSPRSRFTRISDSQFIELHRDDYLTVEYTHFIE